MKHIQGSDNRYRTTITLDHESKLMFDMYMEYAKEVLGLNISQSVLIRTAIRELWLQALAEIYTDQTARKAWSKEDRMKALNRFHKRNRRKLLKAAGKIVEDR